MITKPNTIYGPLTAKNYLFIKEGFTGFNLVHYLLFSSFLLSFYCMFDMFFISSFYIFYFYMFYECHLRAVEMGDNEK